MLSPLMKSRIAVVFRVHRDFSDFGVLNTLGQKSARDCAKEAFKFAGLFLPQGNKWAVFAEQEGGGSGLAIQHLTYIERLGCTRRRNNPVRHLLAQFLPWTRSSR
jgi:hypothetical protein